MENTYFITQTHNGIRAKARPGKDLPKEIFDTFQHAIGAYGFLVPLNKIYSADQWIESIKNTYATSPRITAIVNSIKVSMFEQNSLIK